MEQEWPREFNNCEVTADAEPEPETDAEVAASTSTSSEQRAQKRSDIWEFIEELDDGTYSCLCCTRSAKTQICDLIIQLSIRDQLLQALHNKVTC
ncbi:hypothetical protein P3T76_005776 [Phytophthora citrophthora]|uniref:BED-type domain-containing protein n=1 Tax=Phytophthora citrophthora TaxID=4793 RepID=A0AAD9GQG1_9STRA|nr:hypothetical protein P3T76_005776 [Phytophthora citrophthora]